LPLQPLRLDRQEIVHESREIGCAIRLIARYGEKVGEFSYPRNVIALIAVKSATQPRAVA